MSQGRERGLLALMQDIYHTEPQARTVLMSIGYPKEAIPRFESADTFWPQVISSLEGKVTRGTIELLKATADNNPGTRADVDRLLGKMAEPPPEEQPESMVRQPPGPWGTEQATSGLPPPPPALTDAGGSVSGRDWPTLILEGADLPEQFLAVVRDVVGQDADLLYIARLQSAVRIPDPGDQDEAVRQKVQEEMRALAMSCMVTYQRFSFQPYLYTGLVVYGPDTSGYQMSSVPATSSPEDIAAAIVTQTHDVRSGAKEGVVRVVVDHESADSIRRLDPYTTLHECGVREGDRLRVAPDAIAGSLSPELRMEALLKAVAQIRGYEARNRAEFTIAGCDDEELPGRITVEITGNGLAPPAGLVGLPAGSDHDGLEAIAPVLIRKHQVAIYFSAMFPLAAPEIVWETPVFHPNIRWASQDGVSPGMLQFHPLLLGYRPAHDLANVARMIASIARYRDYDLREGPDSPNPVAALWARTEAGQTMIKAIGGRPLADVLREGDRAARPPRLFWLKPLGGEPGGH